MTHPLAAYIGCKGVLIVEGNYPVLFGDQIVGQVQVTKRGLYYFLSCRCHFSGNIVYRLYVDCGTHRLQLGMLVPEDEQYALQMHIPCSKLYADKPLFYVGANNAPKDEGIILKAEMEISCLSKLEEAYLQKDGDIYRIVFMKRCD